MRCCEASHWNSKALYSVHLPLLRTPGTWLQWLNVRNVLLFFCKDCLWYSYSPSMNLKVEENGWIDCNDLNGTNKRYYCRSSADISLEHAHKGSFVRWFSCWTRSTSKSVLRKKVSGYITCFTLISSNWWCVEGISHLIWNNPNLYEQWPSNPLRTQPQALCPHHTSTHIHTRTHTIIHKHH